jgi:hypothetical protein
LLIDISLEEVASSIINPRDTVSLSRERDLSMEEELGGFKFSKMR